MTTQVRSWLDNAILQSVAESYLHMIPQFGGSRTLDAVLAAGVNNLDLNPDGQGATRLTTTQIAWFKANYDIVTHYPNDATGFSATLFKNKTTGEYTLSFRSTEYQLAGKGGDYERDGVNGTDGEISQKGFALAQLSSMEDFYAHLKNGEIKNPATGQWVSDPVAQQFANALTGGTSALDVTGYSLGAHLATAFTLMHGADIQQTYTYNAAGVGAVGLAIPTRQDITGLIDLYRNMMAWDGQGTPIWWDQLPSESGLAERIDFWQAALAEPNGLPAGTANVYLDAKHQATMAVLAHLMFPVGVGPDPADLSDGMGDLQIKDAVGNWWASTGDGPLGKDPNQFNSKLYTVGAWGNEIKQFYGHGEFFDPQAVANSGYHAPASAIWIEDLPVSRAWGILEMLPGVGDTQLIRDLVGNFGETHSITPIIDSLTVLDLLQGLDNSTDNARFTQIMKAMSNRVDFLNSESLQAAMTAASTGIAGFLPAAALAALATYLSADKLYEADAMENFVNALTRIFTGTQGSLTPTKMQDGSANPLGYADINARNALHAAIEAIRASTTYQQSSGLVQIQALASVGATDMATRAKTDMGYRYALKELLPFAITGDDALYAQHNATGGLDYYDAVTGTGSLTDAYLKDRADMLVWKIKFDYGKRDIDDLLLGVGDKQYDDKWDSNIADNWEFIDRKTQIDGQPLKLKIDGLGVMAYRQIVFGSDFDESDIDGGSRSDRLYGGGGNDTLTGNGGNDYLEGGEDFDIYVLNSGDGYDTILDTDGLGVVKFGAVEAKGSTALADSAKWEQLGPDTWADTQNGITYLRSVVDGETRLLVKKGDSSALVRGWSDGELGITLGAGAPLAPTPTVLTGTATGNYLNNPGTGSRKVEGQAGKDMIWGAADVDQLYGGDGNDWIMGNLGADHIEGGLGNDYITGLGDGAHVKGGDGNDIITATSAEYMVIDGPRSGAIPGITADIIWTDVSQHWTAGYNLLQMYQDGSLDFQVGGGVAINSLFSGASALGGGWTYQFTVSGGTFLLKYYHPTLAPNGEAPATNLYHKIYSGYALASGVYLSGEAGDDLLVGNNGDDVLDGGTGADILIGEAGHDVLLGGDNNDSLFGEAGNDVLDGGAGTDELYGGLGEDILDGGVGADVLAGGAGNDTYLNVTGDDVISDTEGHDTIQLAAATGLGAGGLSVVNTGDQGQYRQLNIALDTGETLKLDDAFFGSSAAIQFVNGDVLDLETLVGATLVTPLYLGLDDGGGRLYGGAAADILNGGSGDDILAGHLGNDTLQGGYGNDVYLVSRGDGQETIFEVGGDADILRFDESIRPEDIKPIRWYGWDYSGHVEDSLRLEWLNKDGPSPKTEYVHIKNYFESADDSRRVDRIEFSNGGTVWTYADIQALLLEPTNGQDTLEGFAGVDVIDGLDGHDSINGKTGDDILNGGSGDDDLQGGLGNDTLLGGAGNDRLLGYATWLDDTSAANNDAGVDVLYGGTGDDLMFGGQGNDIYLFGRGDGYDEIGEIPNASGPSTDVLRLGAGVLPEHVTLYRVLSPSSGGTDGDLLVVLDGSPTQILIRGYFSSEDRQIERIEFDGGAGAVWMAADINAFVVAGTQNGMVGTSADDVFVVDHEFDSISESLNGGTDAVVASRTPWQLPANVENLTLTGFLNIGAYGNGLNNILKGNSGNNLIVGNGGYDIAYGGLGDDVYKDVDQIVELAGEGIDTLLSIGGTLPDNVENMYMGKYGQQVTLSGYGAYDFSTLYSGSIGIAIGNDLDNILVSPGSGSPNQAAPFVLDGRGGTDTMVVNAADKVTVYIDNPGDGILGTPYEIRSYIDYTLPEEPAFPVYSVAPPFTFLPGGAASSSATTRLVLLGNDSIDGVGNSLNNVLDSTENTAINTLIGGKGDDYYRLGVDDVAVELANEGFDTVEIYSAANASMPSIFYDMAGKNIEKVILTGYQPGTVIGSLLDDYIVGNDANNDLQGNGGNDTLDGRGGTDTLAGGGGDDLYYADASDVIVENVSGGYDTTIFSSNPYGSLLHNVMAENVEEARSNGSAVNIIGNSAANRIVGDSWNNRLSGGDGSDILNGGYGNDTLIGDSGNDRLEGGDGIDDMAGGVGDDVYVVDNAGDTVTENVDEGRDGVESIVTYTLGANVEILALVGAAAIDGTGNNLANVLIGNGLANVLDGGLGADTMAGGLGNDTYVVDNVGDIVTENSTLATEMDTVQSSITYTLGAYVENLTLTGIADLEGTGNTHANVLRGNGGYNILWGLDGGDTIYAGDGDEAYGGAGNDTLLSENLGSWSYLWGEAGDDVLLGGSYSGFFAGGLGSDIVTGGSGMNFIWGDDQEFGGEGGNDTITGGNDYDFVIAGAGDDVVYGNGGGDNLKGNQGNDTLYGGSGNDFLNGGQGIDRLVGGTGDDTYTVDNVSDIVTENAGEGTDTVQSLITYMLGSNVENLTLMNSSAIDGMGNGLNNALTGNSASNRLTGGAGDDILSGSATGTSPSTTVSSLVIYARGTPVLDVYPSMQVYVDGVLTQEFNVNAASYTAYTVDSTRLGMAVGRVDVVFRNDAWRPDIGQDRNLYVQKIEVNGQSMNATDNSVFMDVGTGSLALDGVNVRLGQETLASNGSLRFSLGDNDTLDGGVGVDRMSGGSGNDSYMVDNIGDVVIEMPNEGVDTVRSTISYVLGDNLENLGLLGTAALDGTGNSLDNLLMGNAGNNVLSGETGSDTLIGYAGNDRLDGGAGNDFLYGGQGNDTYVIDSTGDSPWENANEGWDTIESSISYTLRANFENLTLTGISAINGTGNELDNNLIGNSANNLLSGGAGNDNLDGGTGADFMIGGVGDDSYVVDNAGDIVAEYAGEGTADSIGLHLSADYTLGTDIEYVYRYGNGSWTTTGNAADNYLYGNSGSDTLIGLAGDDLLWGDAGADTLIGGVGNDRYYVNSVGDIVTEATGEGVDTVYVFGSVAYTLAANVENGYRTFWEGSLTGNELDNSLSGSWGVDTLDGGAGADTLSGWGGDDTLMGGLGSDTYMMGRGYGIDAVVENDATPGDTDVVSFMSDTSVDQIWFQQVGNNLEASIIGTNDKLVINDWYLGSDHHVEQFQTTDGAMTLLDNNVQNLVNAMASFAPPAPGQTTLPTDYQVSLAPVIAANWQ